MLEAEAEAEAEAKAEAGSAVARTSTRRRDTTRRDTIELNSIECDECARAGRPNEECYMRRTVPQSSHSIDAVVAVSKAKRNQLPVR